MHLKGMGIYSTDWLRSVSIMPLRIPKNHPRTETMFDRFMRLPERVESLN